MKFHGTVSIFGLLGFLCCGGLAVDCRDKNSLVSAQRRCFSDFGLDLGVSLDQIQNTIQNDPAAICRNPDSYKSAMQCAMDVSKTCLQQTGQSTSILPDTDNLIHGITYLCNNMHKIDTQCIQDRNPALQQCATNRALAAFSGNRNTDVAYITCKAFEITVDCVEMELASCALQTKDVFVYFIQEYITPPACRSSGHIPTLGHVTVAPLTTFQLVTWTPMLSVSCYSESSIRASQQKCFQQEGISIELPEFHAGDGMRTKQSYLDALMSNNRDLHRTCRELTTYQRAMGCAMDVARRCLPSDYKDYLTTSRQAQMLLKEMCDNVDDINQDCVVSKASSMFDCGYRYGQQIRTTDIKELLCRAYEYNVKCLQEVLPACGQRTMRLYSEMAKKYLNAPACPAIGMAAHSTASLGLLAVAAFLAHLISL